MFNEIKEFIMENINWIMFIGIVGTIITGIATILKVMYDNKLIKKENKDEYSNLHKEHSCLHKEHNNLKQLYTNIDNKENGIIKSTDDIKKVIDKMNDREIKKFAKIENLGSKELDVNKTVEHILSINQMLIEKSEQINKLNIKINNLEKENQRLKSENQNNYENDEEYER